MPAPVLGPVPDPVPGQKARFYKGFGAFAPAGLHKKCKRARFYKGFAVPGPVPGPVLGKKARFYKDFL